MSTQVLPLDTRVPITDTNGMPTAQFIQYWQQLIAQANNAAGALMPAPAPVTVYLAYTGTPLTGEIPRIFAVKRYLNGTDVSAKTRWFLTVKSGTIAASISQTGLITITSAGAGGVLTLRSSRDNVVLECDFPVNTVVGTPPPVTGTGGGTSYTASTFYGISSTTHANITDDIVVTVGSTGVVNLQATLTVRTARSSPAGNFPVYGIWRWWNGSAYVDVGTEVQTSPDCSIDFEAPAYYLNSGSLNVASSKTGLTVGSSQKFQFFARNGVGTRAMSFLGTATATGA